jgi:hypothetical protein
MNRKSYLNREIIFWYTGAFFVLAVAMSSVLFLAGRGVLGPSGQILFWVGDINSSDCSQQISDWYSASHFIHGILFFGLLSLWSRRISLKVMFVLSIAVEAIWEILENSPLIINRYREATMALGYTGDSILNSVSDLSFMVLGFVFARYVPWWVSILMIIFLELFVGYMIHDNLFLNVLMLVYPIDSVRVWQAGV